MFYDLNLALDGVGGQTRRELVAMAMQLGYTGVAANYTFTGIMADTDRCKIRPLELQTILSAAPTVAEAARFHRELLAVPHGLPFRQFTRITVVVENPAQANALNSGNPVLKTYDIVAVRPTNQKAFNQACSHSEADLISLDLGQKLPFRIKMPVVKAAVERGVHFEISYGRTIFDPKSRRELIANTQMLLAAARGRNIIVSSGARRALELRGPNDAANMSTLFGLNLESAKAAVSRNSKAVLMHGVMRKATHRSAIHIGQAPVTENAVDPDDIFNVPMDWDPLSLGGSSADFIPMGDTPDAASKREAPLSIVAIVSEETITSTVQAGDSTTVASSSQTSVKNRVVDEQAAAQVRAVQEKDEGATATPELGLWTATARGLKAELDLRGSVEVSSSSARKECLQQFAVVPLGRQAARNDKQKPTIEKVTPKKGKKRKRKK